uniref:DUF4408 domain-containing protein n=2 Tax=Hordeum vulgare subsp. vulgare TaxID=112509 RepID=A0A8I6X052_HORVV
MDAPDVTPAWSLVRGYFSPATLFLLLNVVIGTIALTSRSRSRSHRRHDHHHGDDDDRHHQQKDHGHQYAPPPPPAPLARTSSVMERLRSLGLYRFRSGDFPPEYNYSHPAAGDTGDDDGSSTKQQYSRSRSEPAARKPASKTGNEAEKAARAKVATKKPVTAEVRRLERAPVPAPARLVQRAPRAPAARAVLTEARRPDAGAPEAACVDERADDFINKFRQQLQLQRLNSLLNYKEMLNRGA